MYIQNLQFDTMYGCDFADTCRTNNNASGLSFLSGIIETDILFGLTNNIRYTKINVILVSLV